MNDTVIIAMPVWAYWLVVVWVSLDAVKITLQLVNQFLAWRVKKGE